MTGLKRDLLFAVRMYRRTPVFTVVAIAMLAVAIGVATATFGHYSRLTLQPIPGVVGSKRIVSVGFTRQPGEWPPMSMAQSEQFKEMMTSAEAFFALGFSRPEKLVLGDGSQAEAHIEPVNQEFFRDAGVPMLLGTDFAAASADPAATNLIVSERFWREALGGSRSVIGSAVEFDGISYTIVGVSGGGFAGLRNGRRADAWMTLARNAATFGAPPMVPENMRADFSQRIPSVQLYARLKPGMSIDDAQTELDALLPRFRENWRSLTQKGLVTAWVMEGNAWNPWAYQSQLRRIEMMFAGALLILIIASLNLASYFLARGVGRMQEFRTRLAIGASRSAVVRQLFLEGIVIVAGAAVLGGILNIWLSGVLLIGSDTTPAGFDWRVAVFVLAAAASLAVVASLVPALRLALKPNLAAATQSALGRQSSRWQPLLVLQVLIATLVVVAGTLFVGELVRLKHADVGFDADGLLVGELYFRTDATSVIIDHSGNRGIEADLAKRLDAVPGIESYAFGMAIPFTGRGLDAEVIAPVGTAARTEEQRRAHPNIVTSGFFETLGIPIVGGRLFDAEMPGEALVSRAFAQRFWGTEDVIGKQFSPVLDGVFNLSEDLQQQSQDVPRETFTIVGVVGDVRYGKADEAPPVFYLTDFRAYLGNVVVRGMAAPEVVHPVVDEFVRDKLSPHFVAPLVSMTDRIHRALTVERWHSRFALGASLIALVLTMVGLYASLQHMVESRRSEFAVRKALGATAATTGALILGRATAIVLAGVLLAVAVALAFREQVEPYLFGLDLTDVRAWGVAVLVIAVTSLGAAWLPARRASLVDPAVALRYE